MMLSDFPKVEGDTIEFKSSRTKIPDALAEKLMKAGSAFSNTGGGWFLAGVNDHGNADGGIPLKIGKQDLRDWVDRVLHNLSPFPKYEVELITEVEGRGELNDNHVVLAVSFLESLAGPHMADDKRYYIRAGAHSVPARHFIVEGIRAKRQISSPKLSHIARIKPFTTVLNAMLIEIVSISDAPALQLEIDITPRPERGTFPLAVSLVDKTHSFVVEFETGHIFGFTLDIKFFDLMGIQHEYRAELKADTCIPIGTEPQNPLNQIAYAVEQLTRAIEGISRS